MAGFVIRPGMKIDIQQAKTDKNEKIELTKSYQSSIFDMDEDAGTIDVYMPTFQGKLILMTQGLEYYITFVVPGSIYRCKARVVDRLKNKATFIARLKMVTDIEKYQRRQYFRLDCALEVRYRKLTVDESVSLVDKKPIDFNETIPLMKSVMVDISGGGMRFLSPVKVDLGNFIFIRFKLKEQFEVFGKIKHVRASEKRPGVYEHRVEFLGLDNSARDTIVRFIFEQERQRRKSKLDM